MGIMVMPSLFVYNVFVRYKKAVVVVKKEEDYKRSVMMFRDMYGDWPGDVISTQRIAQNIKGGNGDGRVTHKEIDWFWRHLSESGMLFNDAGEKFAEIGVSGLVLGKNVPRVMNNIGMHVEYVGGGENGNVFAVGEVVGSKIRAGITRKLLKYMDEKYDDGRAISGSLMCLDCDYANDNKNDESVLYVPFVQGKYASSGVNHVDNVCLPQFVDLGNVVMSVPEVAVGGTVNLNCEDEDAKYQGAVVADCAKQGDVNVLQVSGFCNIKKCAHSYSTSNISNVLSVATNSVNVGEYLQYSCQSGYYKTDAKCVNVAGGVQIYPTPECSQTQSSGVPGNFVAYGTNMDFQDSGVALDDSADSNDRVFSTKKILDLLGRSSVNNDYLLKYNNGIVQSGIIEKSGKIGIGLSSPQYILDVQGMSKISGGLNLDSKILLKGQNVGELHVTSIDVNNQAKVTVGGNVLISENGNSYFAGGTVGFGTSNPNQKSLVDFSSTTKGLLFPRFTVIDRDNMSLSTIDEGMIIFNTDDDKLEVWDGSAWIAVGGNTDVEYEYGCDGCQLAFYGLGNNVEFSSAYLDLYRSGGSIVTDGEGKYDAWDTVNAQTVKLVYKNSNGDVSYAIFEPNKNTPLSAWLGTHGTPPSNSPNFSPNPKESFPIVEKEGAYFETSTMQVLMGDGQSDATDFCLFLSAVNVTHGNFVGVNNIGCVIGESRVGGSAGGEYWVFVSESSIGGGGSGTPIDTTNFVNLADDQTIDGLKTFSKDVLLSQNLIVTGTSTFKDNITAEKNLTVTGTSTFKDNITAEKNLTVTGTSTFKDNITAEKNLTVTGSIASSGVLSATSVGVGTTTPNVSAALDINSTTQGLLLPRLTTAQRDTMTPTAGLTIYNTTTQGIEFWNGGEWRVVLGVQQ